VAGLQVLQPESLDEALAMLRDEGPLTPIAGCTDVLVALNAPAVTHAEASPTRRYLDVFGLAGLRGIEMHGDGGMRIGAGVTHTELVHSPAVARHLPILAAACREVGGVQIQNRGTLGGNVANASPAGDTLPVLAVAEAVVVLRSAAAGERRVAFDAFYTGYRASVMRPDELIVAFEIPHVEGPQWFRKVGTRAAQAISKIVMAAVGGPRPRVAFGSVGPTVLRAPRTEAALASGAPIDEAVRLLGEEITPMDDIRSTASYRLRVSQNLLRRWWEETSGT
jgi:CO/xanthine dehydrogenase FAD-binding subunit